MNRPNSHSVYVFVQQGTLKDAHSSAEKFPTFFCRNTFQFPQGQNKMSTEKLMFSENEPKLLDKSYLDFTMIRLKLVLSEMSDFFLEIAN